MTSIALDIFEVGRSAALRGADPNLCPYDRKRRADQRMAWMAGFHSAVTAAAVEPIEIGDDWEADIAAAAARHSLVSTFGKAVADSAEPRWGWLYLSSAISPDSAAFVAVLDKRSRVYLIRDPGGSGRWRIAAVSAGTIIPLDDPGGTDIKSAVALAASALQHAGVPTLGSSCAHWRRNPASPAALAELRRLAGEDHPLLSDGASPTAGAVCDAIVAAKGRVEAARARALLWPEGDRILRAAFRTLREATEQRTAAQVGPGSGFGLMPRAA